MADLISGTVSAQVRIRAGQGGAESEMVVTMDGGHLEMQFDHGRPPPMLHGRPRLRHHVGPPRVTLTLSGVADQDGDGWPGLPWDHGIEWCRVEALLQAAAMFDAGDRDAADELASVALMWPTDPDQRAKARAALLTLAQGGTR